MKNKVEKKEIVFYTAGLHISSHY